MDCKKVLVIDDCNDNLELAEDQLAQEHNLTTWNPVLPEELSKLGKDGQEIMEELQSFEVVLTDMLMPPFLCGPAIEEDNPKWVLESPLGIPIALQFAQKSYSASHIAVVSCANHHDSPFAGLLDYMGDARLEIEDSIVRIFRTKDWSVALERLFDNSDEVQEFCGHPYLSATWAGKEVELNTRRYSEYPERYNGTVYCRWSREKGDLGGMYFTIEPFRQIRSEPKD